MQIAIVNYLAYFQEPCAMWQFRFGFYCFTHTLPNYAEACPSGRSWARCVAYVATIPLRTLPAITSPTKW